MMVLVNILPTIYIILGTEKLHVLLSLPFKGILDMFLGAICYADDTVLLAQLLSSLKQIL